MSRKKPQLYENTIDYWCKLKGVKKTHIAKICGVANQTVSSWSKNESQPDLNQGAIIADELGISLDDLVKRKEN